MGELVPSSWDWLREYEEIRQALTKRWKYRMGGRPYPTELTNAEEIIQTLERMKPILKKRINEELKEQAVSAMQHIADAHTERLTKPTRASGSETAPADIPRTPSEVQLEQVRIMQHWAEKDAKDQDHARFELRIHKYCETDCPYPDVCDDTKWRHGCLLKQLSGRVEVRGFFGKKIVPAPYTETDLYALKRIRQSRYYNQDKDEPFLRSVWKHGCKYQPQLCRHWARELLGRVDNRCRVCKKSAYALTGCRPGDPVY